MNASEVEAAVRQLKPRFLEGLAPSELSEILAPAKLRRFAATSLIVRQGDPANHIFLILEGRGRYCFTTPDGQKVVLLWLPPGEVTGGAAILSKPQVYMVDTEAIKDTTVLAWNRDSIRGLARRYPLLLENAMLIGFDYLIAYRAVHTSLLCHTARQRLAKVLANLASGMGQQVEAGVELDVMNEELANEANVTPFTTSRLLNEWQRKGLVVKSRGKLLVRSPQELSLQGA